MLGGIVKGIGSGIGSAVKGIGGAVAETAGLSDFTSALGMGADKPTDKPKAAKPKPFDEDESPTKILKRILTEVQTIHKVMASQVVPPSEEEEIQRDKDKKDDEVLDALEDLGPKEDKGKKKKTPWWKMLWAWILPFIKWITKPLSWIKSLLKLPFIMGLTKLVITLGRFLLFNPVGIALLTIGIIAINWRAIKKAIKGYWATFKGWVKTTLNFLGLGGLMPEEVEVLGDSATDDESSADDVVSPEVSDEEVLQALEDLPDADETTTDDAMDDPDDVSISTSHTGTVSGLSEEQSAVLASQGVGSTDAATGATIVGPDHPVTVTPKDAGTDIGPIVSQSAAESTEQLSGLDRVEALYGAGPEAEPLPIQEWRKYEDVTDGDPDMEWSEYALYKSGYVQNAKKYAGQFQVGGKIPQGSEGLVHPNETVRGQGESRGGTVERGGLVPGPATVTRGKPEKRQSMRDYWKQQASHSIGGGGLGAEFGSQQKGKKGSYDREYLRAGMTEADKLAEADANRARLHQEDMDIAGTSGKAGGIDAIARQRRAGLKAGQGFGLGQIGKALIDPRNVTKEAQAIFSIDPTQGWSAGRTDVAGLAKVGWDAELLQNMIKDRSKGRGGGEFSPKQIKFYMAVADFGIDFAQLKDINNTRIRELGTLQDAAGIDSRGANQNWAITILNAMRQNLESQDLTESIEGGMRMVAAQMQNMPSINESTLQQAGQQTTVTVVNQSNTQNISTASSSSKQNNVGQTQQSIPISNTHGAAPASV